MIRKKLAWHWGQYLIPTEWEAMNYSLHSEKGALQFFTREGLQATYSWRTVAGLPDHRRIQAELCRMTLRDNVLEKVKEPSMEFQHWGDFQICLCKQANLVSASLHIPANNILIDWRFSFSELTLDIYRETLSSYKTNDADRVHWVFQDMGCRLPDNFYPNEVKVMPGSSMAQFSTYRHEKVILRRWALPEELLGKRSLEEYGVWLMKHLNRKILKSEAHTIGPNPAISITYNEMGKFGFEGLIGSWWRGLSTIWKDEASKRVYAFENYGPKGKKLPSLEESWL